MNELDNVKPGDLVMIDGYYEKALATVDRVTATQIVCGESRFRKTNGRRLGDRGWHTSTLRIPRPADVEKIRAKDMHKRLIALLQKHGNEWSAEALTKAFDELGRHALSGPRMS